MIRAGVAISLGAVLAVGAISFARPAVTTASPVRDIVPLTQAAFSTTVGTRVQLDTPATISFTTPMERASVEAALKVEPSTDITLRWNDDDTRLAIAPATHWEAGTFYTITVGPGALASTGRPMTSPVRAAFLTRAAATATMAATSSSGSRVSIDSAFTVTFDQPVDPTSIAAAIRLEPGVALTTRFEATVFADGADVTSVREHGDVH